MNCRGPRDDVIGLAGVVNGLSAQHHDYLAAGGVGIIVGDGRLNYAPEEILEFYYDAKLPAFTRYVPVSASLTFDYQFVNDPGYNADRGPANIVGARLHLDY